MFALHKTSEHSSNSQSSKLANFTHRKRSIKCVSKAEYPVGPPVPATANLLSICQHSSDAVNNNLGIIYCNL